MQRPAAEALVRVNKKLAEQGYGLMVFDAYRPWSVTKMFWEATPEKQHIFVADPSQGLAPQPRLRRGPDAVRPQDRQAGRDGRRLRRDVRPLLRRTTPAARRCSAGTASCCGAAMEAEGFTVYEAEWWHFDYKDWQKYPIGNLTFEEIAAKK